MTKIRKQNTKTWRTDLKPPKHPPLITDCFKCKKEFAIKYVFPFKRYSLKNSWAYWTGETESDLKICDPCLYHLYKYEKPLYWEKIKDEKKRGKLGSYISNEDIRPN